MCSCLLTFLLTLAPWGAAIPPESYIIHPLRCLADLPTWTHHPQPGIVIPTSNGPVTIALPPRNLYGTYAIRYCIGERTYSINGNQRYVIREIDTTVKRR